VADELHTLTRQAASDGRLAVKQFVAHSFPPVRNRAAVTTEQTTPAITDDKGATLNDLLTVLNAKKLTMRLRFQAL
jgi:hypothetical protein